MEGARLRAKVENLHPAWLAAAIGLGALGFRIWIALHYRDDTIGHLVKGVPVYDGAHWDAMSADFAAGAPFSGLGPTGFDALRPFRWIFMGAIYSLTGPHVPVTQVMFTLLGVAAVMMTFELLRRLTVWPVALLGAAYRAFSVTDARYGLTTASEPLGAFLSTLFLLLFVIAAQNWQRPRNRWYWLTAGVVLGLTMLTRPEVLPLLVTLPAALVVLRGRPPLRRVMVATVGLGCGVLVVIAPWLIRQRVKYDIWQISFNAPEVLYAATSPRYRVWQPAVKALTIDKGIHDRVVFYSEGVRQNLHEHFRFYLGNAWVHTTRIAEALSSRTPLLVALGILVAAALLYRPPWRVLLPAVGIAIVLWFLPASMLCLMWLAGLAYALVRRAPMLLVGVFAATPIVALGLTAMSGDDRLLYALEWPVFTLAAWLMGIAVGLAPAPADLPDWGRASRIVLRVAAIAVLLLVVGWSKALLARIGDHSPHEPTVVAGTESSTWIARALEGPAGAAYAPLRDRLEVRKAIVRPDYVMHYRAGERIAYWNPLFSQPRRYPFSVLQPVQESYYVLPDTLAAQPKKWQVFIGIPVSRPQFASSFEVIAVSDPNGSMAHPDEATARLHAAELTR